MNSFNTDPVTDHLASEPNHFLLAFNNSPERSASTSFRDYHVLNEGKLLLRENCCNSHSTIREEARLFAKPEAKSFTKMEDLNDPRGGEEN